jgi:23S rRNA G2445 N2-methylase RlmL
MKKDLFNSELSFFLVVTPGLESLAIDEFKEKWILAFKKVTPIYIEEEGGISFKCHIKEIEYLSHYLKLPTRILLRLGSTFKVRDFPKLYTKCKSFTWLTNYLVKVPETIKCITKKSRLIHSTKIESTIRDGLTELFRNNPPKKKLLKKTETYSSPVLHVRILNDDCQLSLDVTGGNLYKRGKRVYIGEAPIRENIAAAFVYFCNSHKNEIVCDPMCGSSSLLLESHTFYEKVNREKLSYLTIPFVLKNIESLIPLQDSMKDNKIKTYGFDLCKKTLDAARKNNQSSKLYINDIWSNWPINKSLDQIILNPPWNKRIKLDKDHKRTHFDLFDILANQKTKSIGMILPREIKLNLFKIKPSKKIFLSSGGINIQFLYWAM